MDPKKILAIKLRSLGDTVLLTAPLLEIKRIYPEAQLDVVVVESWAEILENFPGISRIWKYKRQSRKLLRAYEISKLALQLKRVNYDLVFNFHASTSSATLALATGAGTRAIHYHGHTDKDRHSSVTIPGKGIPKPIVERDMDTIRALGLHIPAGRLPKLFLQSSEVRDAENFLKKRGLNQPLLGLSLGASRITKSWPLQRYVALAIEWCKVKKGHVLAFAGPEETPLIHSFLNTLDDHLTASFSDAKDRAEIRSSIHAVNQLDLRPLAAVLSRLKVLAGNDSGPKHLAVAVGTPTVTLFGPEHPFEWHPYPPEKHPYLFIEDLKCRTSGAPQMPSWCGIETCDSEEHKCMRLIGVDQVFTECLRLAD
jgi:ADP-heptose:LPS heptosyltransferase